MNEGELEVGLDEAGRGPLFGRVYIGAVIIPPDETFQQSFIKDSKKFTSKKKLQNTADYVKQNALAWHVEFVDADVIDKINILKAVMKGMHNCIKNVIIKLMLKRLIHYLLLN